MLVTAYRLLNIPSWHFEGAASPGVQTEKARAIFVNRRLTYLDTRDGSYAAPEGDGIVVNAELFRWPDLEKAPHALFLSAFDEDDVFQTRAQAQEEIDALTGLLTTAAGRNVAGHHVFDLEVDLSSGNYIGTSGAIAISLEPEELEVNEETFSLLSEAIEHFMALDPEQRQRLSLASRWYVKATREEELDKFISFWIALEVLAMPNESNVRPALQRLADIYEIDFADARETFPLGRLQGIRSNIVHDGRTPALARVVNDFVAAVYRDLAKDQLGLATGRHAEQVLADSDMDLLEHLRNLSAARDL